MAQVEINSPLSNTQDDLPCFVTGWTDQLGATVTVVFIDGSGDVTYQNVTADPNTGNWSVSGVSAAGTYSITASVAGLCSDSVSDVVLNNAPTGSTPQSSTSPLTINPAPTIKSTGRGKTRTTTLTIGGYYNTGKSITAITVEVLVFNGEARTIYLLTTGSLSNGTWTANGLTLPEAPPLRVVVRATALNANNKVIGKTSKKRA